MNTLNKFLITKMMKIKKKNLPFKIKSILVDKGSCFVAEINSKKVVKVAYKTSNIRWLFNILKYIKTNPNNSTVKIFDYGLIGKDKYYYVMERLYPLNKQHINRLIKNGYVSFVCNKPLHDAKSYPNESAFINDIYQHKYYQSDPNYGNIMLTKNGNYKFIDLETFIKF